MRLCGRNHQPGAGEQSVVAVATTAIFLICNRWPGRPMTMFLTILSAVVSLRYIVWRVDRNTRIQYCVCKALSAAAWCWPKLTRSSCWHWATSKPSGRWSASRWRCRRILRIGRAVDVYVPTYNEDLSIVRATVLAAMAIDWPQDKLHVYILDDGRRLRVPRFRGELRCWLHHPARQRPRQGRQP